MTMSGSGQPSAGISRSMSGEGQLAALWRQGSVNGPKHYLGTVGDVTKLSRQVTGERDGLTERQRTQGRGLVLTSEETWKLEAEAATFSGLSEQADGGSDEMLHFPIGAKVLRSAQPFELDARSSDHLARQFLGADSPVAIRPIFNEEVSERA